MTIRTIVSLPEPILRRKAHKVTKVDSETRALIKDMVETMRLAPGVGLAAPQISVSSRIIVVEYGEEDEEGNEIKDSPKKLYAVINPELTFPTEAKELGLEGCLSVPGLVGEVERFKEVLVKGLNRQGNPVKIKASGWLARIFQHEVDHLDGILYTDRATRIWKPQKEDEVEDV